MREQQNPPPPIPKFDTHSLVLYFWQNWAVIKRYRLLFAVAATVCGVLGGALVRIFDSRQIEILAVSNAQLRDQKTALQQTAAILPPSLWRRLLDQERIDLLQGLREWSSKPKRLIVYAMPDSESRHAAQFVDVLRSVGIEPQPKELPLSMGPTDVGLMVGVVSFGTPSADAQTFLEILNKSGLSAHFTPWAGSPGEDPTFDLFIGPKPW